MYKQILTIAAMSFASTAGAGIAGGVSGSVDVTTKTDAEMHSEMHAMAFQELDTNQDGSLDQAEVQSNAEVASEFAVADTNGDRQLSAEEFAALESEMEAASEEDEELAE